jgi:hypothetical protein
MQAQFCAIFVGEGCNLRIIRQRAGFQPGYSILEPMQDPVFEKSVTGEYLDVFCPPRSITKLSL